MMEYDPLAHDDGLPWKDSSDIVIDDVVHSHADATHTHTDDVGTLQVPK
jgi:hypothetical protein